MLSPHWKSSIAQIKRKSQKKKKNTKKKERYKNSSLTMTVIGNYILEYYVKKSVKISLIYEDYQNALSYYYNNYYSIKKNSSY